MDLFIIITASFITHTKYGNTKATNSGNNDDQSIAKPALKRADSEFSLGFERSKSFTEILSLSEIGPFCFQYNRTKNSPKSNSKNSLDDIAQFCYNVIVIGTCSYCSWRIISKKF